MKVGSLVECVDNFKGISDYTKYVKAGICFPQVGNIYTVRSIEAWPSGDYIRLEEIINPNINTREGYYGEVQFGVNGFREVQPPMDLSFIEELQFESVL